MLDLDIKDIIVTIRAEAGSETLAILRDIQQKGIQALAEIDDLKREVAETGAKVDSVISFVSGMKDELAGVKAALEAALADDVAAAELKAAAAQAASDLDALQTRMDVVINPA